MSALRHTAPELLLYNFLCPLQIMLENEVLPKLQLLYEGHVHLQETLAPKAQVETLEGEVVTLKSSRYAFPVSRCAFPAGCLVFPANHRAYQLLRWRKIALQVRIGLCRNLE